MGFQGLWVIQHMGYEGVNCTSEMPQIDPSTLELKDKLRSWKEAKALANAKHWEEGDHDELKLLKEMCVQANSQIRHSTGT